MSDHYTVLGLFKGTGKVSRVADIVEPLKEKFSLAEADVSLLSSAAFPEHSIIEDNRPYPIHMIVWPLGALGFISGVLISGGTGYIMNLIVQNKPPFSFAPTVVITYEFMLLFGVIGSVIALLLFAGLPNWTDRAYDPDISDGALGLLIKVKTVDEQNKAAELMTKHGAYKVKKGAGDF